ncbi:hypothetical protein [Bergeyella sp. RCAD1439]|uniref:hypothetical protein n=1 Tax=Bergeyella anatis TaxID=3113737 RepID=UPI002E184ECF|nr:hypothetical protein [Bergeyella sp. RCAD1439]
MKKRLTGSWLLLVLFLFSCGKGEKGNGVAPKKNNVEVVQKNGNLTAVISTDRNRLGKIIDLTKFPPSNVKYKYVFIDNSKGRIAGPSDVYLEAVFYFDNATMEKIRAIDLMDSFTEQNFEKKEFKFDWLDKLTLKELEHSGEGAHPDFLFGTNNGKLWCLKDKVLLKSTIK